jgi:protein involved in polysaccharide export with SLBB domain
MKFVMCSVFFACLIATPFAAQERQQTISVSIVGEVRVPGTYESSRPLTLTEVLALAKGFTEYSNRHAIEIVRAGKDPTIVDFDSIIRGSRPDIQIQTGDVVKVPALRRR